MNKSRHSKNLHLVLLFSIVSATLATAVESPVATVINTPDCIAFWDFVKREPDGNRHFTAHVSAG